MKKNYTIETRVTLNSEIRDYLNEYVIYYNKIYRFVWKKMCSQNFKELYPKISKFITEICNEFAILKRTANTIRYEVQGRIKALEELKKLEKVSLGNKINAINIQIENLKEKINMYKRKIVKNVLTLQEINQYRKMKEILYYKCNKSNKMRHKYNKMEEDIKNNKLKMCFGTKKMFKKQFDFKKSGYKTHKKWVNDFRKNRDKNICYMGSSDEKCGNQMCQLSYNKGKDKFELKIRKEKRWEESGKYLTIQNLAFKYQKTYLKAMLKAYNKIDSNEYGKYPLTYRFKRRKNRWYIQVIITIENKTEDYITSMDKGVIGLDYNDGFIELSETDSCGNLVSQGHFDLEYHGKGKKAENEIRNTLSKITKYGERVGKHIVIENLNFNKTKSMIIKGSMRNSKKYSKMIHIFDYGRYKENLENVCFRRKVGLILVSPSNTSKIGKEKFCKKKKLNTHQAASYVVARRGQGIKDVA